MPPRPPVTTAARSTGSWGWPTFERARHSPAHRTFRLDRIRALLERLGDPHLQVPTLHVTGTNGKGSTSAMLSSMLQGTACGSGCTPRRTCCG